MDQMPVDIDQRCAVIARLDNMRIPYLFVQCAGFAGHHRSFDVRLAAFAQHWQDE